MHNNNERYIISDLNKKIAELTKKKNESSIHINKSNNDDDSEPNIERDKKNRGDDLER